MHTTNRLGSAAAASRNGQSGIGIAGESLATAGRSIPAGYMNHRRGHSLTGIPSKDATNADGDDRILDLFSRNRRSLSVASSDESSEVSLKLGRLSVGSVKVSRSAIDDLLSSTDGGKNDYDWLLTPPETPLFPSSSDASDSQSSLAAPRSNYRGRSSSTAKPSRLSVSQSESSHLSRPIRSSSVTRPSLSTSQHSYSSNRSSSILNTSSASVSSYTRPSSPSTRSSSTARPSTSSSRITSSRPSTPSRTRPVPASSSTDKPRSSPGSRASTPSGRPQLPANLNSPAVRSTSRPSTPTRRSSLPNLYPSSSSCVSAGRIPSNGRSSAPSSRPSSPGPRGRAPQPPVIPPDFPLDTPPNLRTSLPDRPLSAGRSRPGVALTVKGNSENSGTGHVPRRLSSPIVTRGRLPEPPGKGRVHTNGHVAVISESRRATHVSELAMRKPVKSSATTTDSTGFGRTISKKSLDMAIRHMDIRNGTGTGSIRPLSSTTLFPQSIRSTAAKSQSARIINAQAIVGANENQLASKKGVFSENGNWGNKPIENGSEAEDRRSSAKLSGVDIYESSRYDAILLKEDLKNTNWLHSFDDKSDQGPIFDGGFEPLPEPFGLS